MADPKDTTPDDRPDTGDRGWRGLARDPGERELWLGILALIVLVAGATLLWGLPGLLVAFIALTLVIMVVLVVISVGS
jgi:hypothetical protein